MSDSMRWVDSEGGPLIVTPVELGPIWQGGEGGISSQELNRWGDATNPSGTDYERACGIDDYLGTLEVGAGRALILGDEPMPTAFVPTVEGGVLVRWMYAECEDDVRRAIQSVPESVWEDTPHSIKVGQGGLLVFDSAYSGDDLPISLDEESPAAWLSIELPPGTYQVDTADYSPDESIQLILHRFKKK